MKSVKNEVQKVHDIIYNIKDVVLDVFYYLSDFLFLKRLYKERSMKSIKKDLKVLYSWAEELDSGFVLLLRYAKCFPSAPVSLVKHACGTELDNKHLGDR